jgi:hypothetical protein
VAFALAAWSLLVLASLFVLWRYEHAPGALDAPPGVWPSASRLPREPGRPTLLLFVHPRCPCTRASLRELERLLALDHDRVDVSVVFLRPSGTGPGWEQSDLWDFAVRMPGVNVRADPGGCEAAVFRARTSGTAIVYDAEGRLAFHGGLTVSRGHEGTSAGGDAVRDLVRGEAPNAYGSEVFGCPLFADRDLQPTDDSP